MVPVAGVDGCRGGWVVVTEDRAFVCSEFRDVLDAVSGDALIAVDMPIGLLEGYARGGREADKEARKLLAPRDSVVFPAPPRRAFGATDLAEVQARGVRMTIQAFGLMPKVEELDELMTPVLQQRVREVHPELSFRGMSGSVLLPKRTLQGEAARQRVLPSCGIDIPEHVPRGAASED